MKCLILNTNAKPLSVIDCKQAICKEKNNRILVLKYFDKFWLDSKNRKHYLPAVAIITKHKYVKHIKTRINITKKNIFLRDDYRCGYCGQKFDEKDLTKDHVIPISRGGKSTFDNLICCCKPCNARKDNKLIKPLWEPKMPKPSIMFFTNYICEEWKDYLNA